MQFSGLESDRAKSRGTLPDYLLKFRQLARVVKPGRVIVVHVAQIPRMKRSGESGLFDFRGLNIRLGERSGLTFEYDWVVRKNPQSQAIRGKGNNLRRRWLGGRLLDCGRCDRTGRVLAPA